MNRLTRKSDREYYNQHIRSVDDNYTYEQFLKDRPYTLHHIHSVEYETKLGKFEDLLEKYNINSIEELESIIFMFNIIDKKGFLPLLVESMQSLYTEEGAEYFMTKEEYKVFKEYYPKRMIRKNYGDIDEKLSVFDKEVK